MIICYLVLSFLIPDESLNLVIMMNIIVTFTAVYALRGVYFALLEETNIAGNQTGTAVGLISLIGYTPDVFFHSVAGRILDASPGLPGFQNYFLMLAAFSILGLGSTFALTKAVKSRGSH